MCLIIASPNGRKPSFEVFEDAARTNAHGIGFAWKDKDKILFKKGLSLDEVKTLLEDAKEQWVAHFRIATVGGQTAELTHPFIISNDSPLNLEGEADALLFQNGTFGNWDVELLRACAAKGLRLPDGDWSDTRATAVLVSIYGKNILRFIGSHSRYLVFTNGDKKHADRQQIMWQTGSWDKHDDTGLFFSNKGSCIFHKAAERVSSFGGGADRRPFVPATLPSDTGSRQMTSQTRGSTGKVKRVASTTRSPWQFFGTTGAPERDGIQEALDLPPDNPLPQRAADKASVEAESKQ